MSHKRFYVPRNSIRDGRAILPAGQAHHLRDVMRIKAGEFVEIFDGTGRGYQGEVELQGSVGPMFDVFDLLPVEKEYFPPAPVGGTPLWEPKNLRDEFGQVLMDQAG